ncbi:MAG TPA: RsmG family class I SAM-dependent methyltransferase, partial [Gammaproteobacteria bacterium]
MSGLADTIRRAVAGLREDTPPQAVAQLAALVEELARWNRKVNLTAIRDTDEMVTHHILDSLSARPLLEGRDILDVGTGAGFPG